MIARRVAQRAKLATIFRDSKNAALWMLEVCAATNRVRGSIVWSALADPIDDGLDLSGRYVAEFRHFRSKTDIDVGHLVDDVARAGISR